MAIQVGGQNAEFYFRRRTGRASLVPPEREWKVVDTVGHKLAVLTITTRPNGVDEGEVGKVFHCILKPTNGGEVVEGAFFPASVYDVTTEIAIWLSVFDTRCQIKRTAIGAVLQLTSGGGLLDKLVVTLTVEHLTEDTDHQRFNVFGVRIEAKIEVHNGGQS